MMCPDLTKEDTIYLQNSLSNDGGHVSGSFFYFAVDTCINFAKFTGNGDNCKSETEINDAMSKLVLQTKISEEFYSAITYSLNDM